MHCVCEEAGWAVHHGFGVVTIPFQNEIVYLASLLFAGQ